MGSPHALIELLVSGGLPAGQNRLTGDHCPVTHVILQNRPLTVQSSVSITLTDKGFAQNFLCFGEFGCRHSLLAVFVSGWK